MADADPKGRSAGTPGNTNRKFCARCNRPVPRRRKRNHYVCALTPKSKGKPCRPRELRLKDIERQRDRRGRQ